MRSQGLIRGFNPWVRKLLWRRRRGYLREAPRPSKISPKYHTCCLQTAQRKVQIRACNKEGIKPMLLYLFENTDSFRNQMNVMKPLPKRPHLQKNRNSLEIQRHPQNPSKDFRFIVSP